MQCKSLWIEASAKCITVNVKDFECKTICCENIKVTTMCEES